MRVMAPVLAGGMLLAGCSDLYFDRRETISPAAGDALATNRVTQMVDPWSPASANKNIAFNATTSSVAYQAAAAQAGNAQNTTASASSTSAPPASSVAGYGNGKP
jgi:hypothetical protein